MKYLKLILFFAISFNVKLASAQHEPSPISTLIDDFTNINSIDFTLILIALFLLIPIYHLSKVFRHILKKHLEIDLNKKSASVLIVGMITIPQLLTAQGGGDDFFQFDFLRWFLLLTISIEVSILVFFSKKIYSFYSEKETAVKGETSESALAQWWKKSNNFIDIKDEKDIDTGHDYDGIRELDNNIPSWFTASFAMSIVFSILYVWVYHVAEIAPLQDEEYQIEVEEAVIAHNQYLKHSGSQVDEENLTYAENLEDIELGKKIYIANCAVCHLDDGGGATGPNLCDENWIYGCSATDVYQSIKYGRKNGMMAWSGNLSDKQIIQLTNYVHSLGGKAPASPKAPQGEICEIEEGNTKSKEATPLAEAKPL